MEYMKFHLTTRRTKESAIRIYPLVCMHVGAPQCDEKFIKEHIYRAKHDPNGYVVYMGDGGECVTKLSKGDIYTQTMSPQEQHDTCVEWMKPIQSKLLFGIRGNHGHRIYKETGLDFDKNLCHRLGTPYMGVNCMINLIVNRSSYDLYFNHGVDSGVAQQTKVTRAEHFGKFIDADAIFTAHSHACIEIQPLALYQADNENCRVNTKMRHSYICGSGYDSRTGYADEKGYPPMLPSYLNVEFDGRIVGGKACYSQRCTMYHADGTRDPKGGE
jgi:hypothetical protein